MKHQREKAISKAKKVQYLRICSVFTRNFLEKVLADDDGSDGSTDHGDDRNSGNGGAIAEVLGAAGGGGVTDRRLGCHAGHWRAHLRCGLALVVDVLAGGLSDNARAL